VNASEPTLFDGAVRSTDPATSRIAAALKRTTLRDRVEAALRAAGRSGATDWELTDLLGLGPEDKPSVGKRRQECRAVDSGVRRKTPKGLAAVVWLHPEWAWAAGRAAA